MVSLLATVEYGDGESRFFTPPASARASSTTSVATTYLGRPTDVVPAPSLPTWPQALESAGRSCQASSRCRFSSWAMAAAWTREEACSF
jgi:hypothetical protein